MTPPVLTEGALGAMPAISGVVAPMVTDPALAAEFAALLGAAMPESLPVASPEAGIPLAGLAATLLPKAPPGEAPDIVPDEAGVFSGREGETEEARSAASEEILDSTLEGLNATPPDLNGFLPATGNGFVCILTMPKTTSEVPVASTFAKGDVRLQTLAVPNATEQKVETRTDAAVAKFDAAIPAEGPDSSDLSSTEAIPDAHLTEVTSISGGAMQFGGNESSDSGSDSDSHSGDGRFSETSTREVGLGEATNLITDRTGEFDVTRTERLEARPLDRNERTRIVHEVIDRVTKHVETLAITRSKDPLTIQLEPADLGRVVVEVSRGTSGLVAEMSATDPRVAEALDKHRGELAAGLAARGHAEARITVNASPTADNPAFDLRRENGQTPQQQQQQPQRHFHAPSAMTNFARPSDRPRTRVRAAGLDLEI